MQNQPDSSHTRNEFDEGGDDLAVRMELESTHSTIKSKKGKNICLVILLILISIAAVIYTEKYATLEENWKYVSSKQQLQELVALEKDPIQFEAEWKAKQGSNTGAPSQKNQEAEKKWREEQRQRLRAEQKKRKEEEASKTKLYPNQVKAFPKYEVPMEYPKAAAGVDHRTTPEHHDKKDLTFPYRTMGIPTPGQKFNFTPVPRDQLYKYDEQFMELFEPYNDTDCEYARYGAPSEGGYVICKNFLGDAEGMINIGVEGRDSLGCHITNQFKIHNYMYDCTNRKQPICTTNEGRSHYYPYCVGEVTENAGPNIYLTLQDMVKRHNLTNKHWVLKIDIEGGQNQAFKYFPVDMLKWIDQIIIEVHFGPIYPEEWGNMEILKTLAEHFVVINFHENNAVCYNAQTRPFRKIKSPAIETAMVNRRLIKINKPTRSFVWNEMNTKDQPQNVFCY